MLFPVNPIISRCSFQCIGFEVWFFSSGSSLPPFAIKICRVIHTMPRSGRSAARFVAHMMYHMRPVRCVDWWLPVLGCEGKVFVEKVGRVKARGCEFLLGVAADESFGGG